MGKGEKVFKKNPILSNISQWGMALDRSWAVSGVHSTVEMSYLRAAARKTLINKVRNEEVYESFQIAEMAISVLCGMLEYCRTENYVDAMDKWEICLRSVWHRQLFKVMHLVQWIGEAHPGHGRERWGNMYEWMGEWVLGEAKRACTDRGGWSFSIMAKPPSQQYPWRAVIDMIFTLKNHGDFTEPCHTSTRIQRSITFFCYYPSTYFTAVC